MTPASSPREIAGVLQQHEPSLRHLHLKSLALFGSVARAEHGPESDLDLLYEFDEGAATLDRLLSLQSFLEEVLERDVDLVPRKYVSPILQRHIGEDVVPLYEAAAPS